jgi:hypothetical protein
MKRLDSLRRFEDDKGRMNRPEFLRRCGGAAGIALAGLSSGLSLLDRPLTAMEISEAVTLKSWELVELSGLPPKLRPLMKNPNTITV